MGTARPRTHQNRSILPALLTAVALILLFWRGRSQPPPNIDNPEIIADENTLAMSSDQDTDDDITKYLKVTARAVDDGSSGGGGGLKLALAVANTHPTDAVTVLTWDSPLDPLAVQLGVLTLTRTRTPKAEADTSSSKTEAGEEKEEQILIPTIQVRRKMPPGPESLVAIGAGQTREQVVELREPMVPVGKLKLRGERVRVVCKGLWRGVWRGERESVEGDKGELLGAKGEFESEAVVVGF
ncbi:uncharacterized protein GGS25DRAFT_480052 [Hypoxylon fragiforme]|uniref:uncharacterized protein n=1 Tax=Hypoxylon fragiforme TaxID=63214 RepID=UPI0020C6B4D6|nr:uncharacterized protein GGS25DRAFT_480052 [Hypoxylon fragiforme]KAI2610803.1 hypothetical protein GGS25DRAFT_480052 [Hypoxylon fragiforme]